MPAAPLVPSERSASNANAIEPSSKPGNEDAVAAGRIDSRFGGGGGGSQLGFDDDIGAGVTELRAGGATGRALGGGEVMGRALASAAAPVPFDGGAFEDGGGDDGCGGAGGAELAKAIVARCVALLARAGNGGGFAALASFGSDAGRPARAASEAAVAAAVASGVIAARRVESIRTAAISVEPSVESE